MLEALLEKLGVKREETRLYLVLLERGACTAGDLAKIIGWPRPNVYNYLQKLCQEGLVKQSERAGVKLFIPEAPQKLLVLYKQKIEDFSQARKQVEELIPKLEETAGNHFLKPRMYSYEGQEQIQTMLQDILLYKDIETYTFWPIRDMLKTVTPEFLRYHNKERIRRRISLHSIWPSDQKVDLQHFPFMAAGPGFLREIRLTPPERVDSSMCYWIYGDKVMFVSSSTADFGFVIDSRAMSQMLRSHHELLWSISTKLEENPLGGKVFLEEVGEEE